MKQTLRIYRIDKIRGGTSQESSHSCMNSSWESQIIDKFDFDVYIELGEV